MAVSFSIHLDAGRLVIFSIFDRPCSPFFYVFSLRRSSLRFARSGPPSLAFLTDKLDSIIANHDGRGDSHVVDRPAGQLAVMAGRAKMSPSFDPLRDSLSLSRGAQNALGRRQPRNRFRGILLSSAAMNRARRGTRELITVDVPAACRILITLFSRLLPRGPGSPLSRPIQAHA